MFFGVWGLAKFLSDQVLSDGLDDVSRIVGDQLNSWCSMFLSRDVGFLDRFL